MRQICLVRWEIGNLTKQLSEKMHPEEIAYFKKYSQCVFDYCEALGGLELTKDIYPPKTVAVKARVLKDIGQITDRYGHPVLLSKDTEVSLNRTDAEQLIRQGSLQHIPG